MHLSATAAILGKHSPISMPLTWEELASAHPLDFRITDVPDRLARTGDRWHDALTQKQSLEKALGRDAGPAGENEAGDTTPDKPGARKRNTGRTKAARA